MPQEPSGERKHFHRHKSCAGKEIHEHRHERHAAYASRPDRGPGERHQHRRGFTNPDQFTAEPRHRHPSRRFTNPERMQPEHGRRSEKMVHPEPFHAPKDLMHEKWMLEKRIFKLKKRLYKINQQLYA